MFTEVKKMSFGKYVTSAAMVAVGLGFAYEADAKLKVGSGNVIGEEKPACVINCDTPAVADVQQPEAKKNVVSGRDCATMFKGKGKCMSYQEARELELRIYEKGNCPDKTRCYKTTTSVVAEKKDCTKLFDGNGRCMSEKEAKMEGYSRLSIGYCPGKDVCYDTTKLVVVEKKAELSQLETIVQPINPDYYKQFSGCSKENAERERLLGQYTESKTGCERAKKNLNDYTANTVPALKEDATKPATESKTPVESQAAVQAALTAGPVPSLPTETAGEKAAETKEVFNAKTAGTLEAEVDRLCGQAQRQEVELTTYISLVNKNGYNYTAPVKPVKVDNFDVTIYAGPSVDTDGNFGGVAGAEVLYRLGWVKLGGYADATLQNQSESESRTNYLGIATEEVKTENELSRYLGGGAAASLPLTSWMELQARLGGAWMRSSAEKTITRLGETGNLSSSAHSLAGEAYTGLRINPYDQWVIDLGVKSNTKSDEATFLFGVGRRF
jgi:hypothetical protein